MNCVLFAPAAILFKLQTTFHSFGFGRVIIYSFALLTLYSQKQFLFFSHIFVFYSKSWSP